jgi:thiamine biosynthesis protein ThiS
VNLVVNGTQRKIRDGATIADLIDDLGMRTRNVVVERNGEAVERDRFGELEVSEGDVIEVVRAVPGG